jgi:hypothetical protein
MSSLQNTKVNETQRKFLLDKMNIRAEYSLASELPHLEGKPSFFRQIMGIYSKILKRSCNNVLLDFDNRISEPFFSAPNNTYLVGYWQSEKYFNTISEMLKSEFTPISI